jgi:murein biosynthesis integral membrane protein MurJ
MSQLSGPLTIPNTNVRMKAVHKQISRALLTLSSAALLVRGFGMLNQIVITRRFGAGAAMDAYFVASTLPLLMGTLLSTSIESSVIPVYTRVRAQGKEQASKLFSTLLNLLVLATILLTLGMLNFRNQLIQLSAPSLDPFRASLAVSLTPIIFPTLALMVVINFLQCILNAEGQFGWPAYADLLVPLTTATLVLAQGRSDGIVILCIGMLVGLSLELCLIIVRARRAGLVYRLSINLRNPDIGAIFMVAWVAPFSVLISQVSPLVDQVFASALTAGSISALNYSLKLVSVFTGVIFVSIGRAALPYLSRQASNNDMKAFKETLRFYLWVVGIGTTVLAALVLVLAHPLVQILFQRGAFTAEYTDRTASTLVGFVVGLTPMALGFLMSRAFVALRKNRLLLITTTFGVFANAILDYFFARLWQSTGIALATSAVYFCNLFILLFMLRRQVGNLHLFTPPTEILQVIRKIGDGSYYLELVTWMEEHRPSFTILPNLNRQIARIGIMIAVFAIGVVGIFWDSLYTLRAAFGSLVVLVLLRYPYVLVIAWVMIDAFIGSKLPIFNGNNLDTALTVPTLLLMTSMPIKQTFRRMPALAILFLYLVWVLAGIRNSPGSTGSLLTQWTLALDYVAIGVLTINVLTTRQHLLRLIDALLIPATFISLYGIYGYITRQNGVVDPTTSLFRIFSIEGAAPALALFLSIVIPPAIYRASTLHGFKRLGVAILVLIFLVAMGLTFTRSAFICVILSVIIMILFLPSRKMKISLLASSLALAVGAVLLATFGNISIFSRFFNADVASLNGRISLWQPLLDRFDPTQLLGHGLGAATILLNNLQVGYGGVIATSPSNLFVAALYDHGIIGLTLLTLMFIVLGAGVFARTRKTTGDQKTLFIMAFVVFVNMVLQSFDADDFWAQSIGIYFWVIMALPFALCWSTTKQSSRTDKGALDEVTEPRVEAVEQAEQELITRL